MVEKNHDGTASGASAAAGKGADGTGAAEAAARAAGGARCGAARMRDGRLTVALDVGGLDDAARAGLAETVRAAVAAVDPAIDVRIAMTAQKRGPLLIAVGSGKGGVGKSTLTTNLAIALSQTGRRVAVVDADIHGPSQPRLLGLEEGRPRVEAEKLVPMMSPHGIAFLSMGHLARPGQAIAWRGPMAGRALEQLVDAHWGDIDLLLVDLPPGTGDIQLSMLQKFKPAGAVIVSTPQDLALIDAARAIDLFVQADVPIIGMVENMAGYACPHCGEVSDPFGAGGAEREAAGMGLDFLGRIPLDRSIRMASDAGVPPAAQGGSLADPFRHVAAGVAAWIDAHGGAQPAVPSAAPAVPPT